MRKPLAFAAVLLCSIALASAALAATAIVAKNQLRGHLPELGEKPTMRVFQTQAAYDSYRSSLGDANVFPPASQLFMTFDKEILALYTRGNDTGGRCIASSVGAALDADTVTVDLSWQNGTCGAPSSAHYPFILLSLSRTAADGSSWITPTRSVCGVVAGAGDTRACATLSGASPAPTASASLVPSASVTPSPTAAPASSAPSATPTPSRTPTPSAPASTPASTSAPASAAPSVSRSPVAAASPSPAPAPAETNYLLYGMLIAIGFLVGVALMLSRGSRGNNPRR